MGSVSKENKEKKTENVIAPVVLVIFLYGVKGLVHIYKPLKWPPVYQSGIFDEIAK